MVTHEDVDGAKPLHRLFNGEGTSLERAEISSDKVKPQSFQFLFAPRNTHHASAACRQYPCRCTANSPACASDQSNLFLGLQSFVWEVGVTVGCRG